MTTKNKTAEKTKGRSVAQAAPAANPPKPETLAKLATQPSFNAAAVIESYASPLGEQDTWALANNLAEGLNDVWAGDTKQAEAMLYGQAHALQSIFMNYARRAQAQQYQKNLESFLRMALKAQNQCRMTLETLAAIKNPPVVFAKQANINHGGQQQVNNGPGPAHGEVRAPAPASDSTCEQTKLLEAENGERLDTRAASEAGRADPQLAPVGAIHRPAQR